MAMGAVPFTPKIQKLLGGGYKTDSYHVTELRFLKGMNALGKTDKPISTFTKNLASVVKSIVTKPDVLIELNGNVVVASDFDIFSHPDKHGVRWIHIRGSSKSDFLLEAISKKVTVEVVKYSGLDIKPDDLLYDDFLYEKTFNNLQDKDKKTIIKFYIERVQSLLENNIYLKIVKELLQKNKGNLKHNEILVNNFKVKGVWAIQAGKYMFNHESAEADITSSGYKFNGYIPADEFHKFK